MMMLGVFLGLSLGDVSGLEDIIGRYKDSVNTDTPLTQFSLNLPCPTQERETFSTKDQRVHHSLKNHLLFCVSVVMFLPTGKTIMINSAC